MPTPDPFPSHALHFRVEVTFTDGSNHLYAYMPPPNDYRTLLKLKILRADIAKDAALRLLGSGRLFEVNSIRLLVRPYHNAEWMVDGPWLESFLFAKGELRLSPVEALSDHREGRRGRGDS